MFILETNVRIYAKGLVAELAHQHAQISWGFRGWRVRVARLAACCNYFSKKKKNFGNLLVAVFFFGV